MWFQTLLFALKEPNTLACVDWLEMNKENDYG